MQERFAPQITEIEPNKLEKRQISFTQKLKMMYLVNPTVAAIILAGGLGLTALGIVGSRVYATDNDPLCTGTYVTNKDNENNAHTGVADNDMDTIIDKFMSNHPVEFNITVPQAGNYILTIKAWSVDTTNADKVYVNGNYIGNLTGINTDWSDSDFPPVNAIAGNNLIEVKIDESSGGLDAIEVGCGILNSPPVGGIAKLPDIGRNPQIAEHSGDGFGAKEYAMMAGSAAAVLGVTGAGLAGVRRKRR